MPENPDMGVPRNMTGIGAKMKKAGYNTAFVGKWDVGMATPDHTPLGRGFDDNLIYFEHKNGKVTVASIRHPWLYTNARLAPCRFLEFWHHAVIVRGSEQHELLAPAGSVGHGQAR